MNSLHLVDPSAREAVAAFPPIDPQETGLESLRATVLAIYPAEAVAREERSVPGPAGAPAVRVLIYRPAHTPTHTGNKRPAILYLHGGGFIAGRPDMMDVASSKLANDSGAVVVAVQYRLAPETPFPGPVEDCYAALAWLFAEADALGVDATRIALLGHSAGGGLAAALALLARDRGAFDLRAQFLIYPMLDPRTGTADAPTNNPVAGEFGWTRKANRYGWDAMRGGAGIPSDRISHFAPALAEDLSGLPATFVGVGSLDLFVDEDITFALRLARAGTPVAAHLYPGGIHGFDAFPGTLADEFNSDLYAAFSRFL